MYGNFLIRKGWTFDGICDREWTGHTSRIRHLQVWDEYLWSASDDTTVKKWSKVGECLLTIDGFHEGASFIKILNDDRMFIGDRSGKVREYTLKGKCVGLWSSKGAVWCLTDYCGYIFSGYDNGCIIGWIGEQ